jgi:hypothetical protein
LLYLKGVNAHLGKDTLVLGFLGALDSRAISSHAMEFGSDGSWSFIWSNQHLVVGGDR